MASVPTGGPPSASTVSTPAAGAAAAAPAAVTPATAAIRPGATPAIDLLSEESK